MSSARFGRYTVELSSTGKPLFPDDGISKGALIAYYRDVAEVMLPHLKDRPLTLHRFPDGIGKPGFYQQKCSDYFPDWISTRKTPRADNGDTVEHVLCNNQATLVYLANQATITLPGAPVATPLDITELGDRRLDPQCWHLKNILRRLGQKTDPWADIRRHATAVDRAHRALRDLQDS